jgi:hypothetical protein
MAVHERATSRWVSFTAATVVALGWAAWSHTASADDPPPKPTADAARSASSAAKPKAVGDKRAVAQRPLDLDAPPINHVLTPQQVRTFVEEPQDQDDGAPADDVTVASPHYLEPVPNGAFGALPWALMHPLQAWRIFTPITN